MVQLPFANRLEAGRLLADQLFFHKIQGDAVVLALPRGGVPVGFAIAERLDLPLDVVVARKLGVPWQPELAMGAIAGPVRVLDERLIREFDIEDEAIDRIVRREQEEAKRREELYRGGRPPLKIRGRSVILVDDGVAMGSTMTAAARYVRSFNPALSIIAVPIGSRQACLRLTSEADDVVCLTAPEPFYAVGQWYQDFRPVSDTEVQNFLAECRHGSGAAMDSHTSVLA
jgi:putative phosphoribosyl transferase